MIDFEPAPPQRGATRPALSATAKFYLGFALALLVVIVLSYGLGYHQGAAHALGHGVRRTS